MEFLDGVTARVAEWRRHSTSAVIAGDVSVRITALVPRQLLPQKMNWYADDAGKSTVTEVIAVLTGDPT